MPLVYRYFGYCITPHIGNERDTAAITYCDRDSPFEGVEGGGKLSQSARTRLALEHDLRRALGHGTRGALGHGSAELWNASIAVKKEPHHY
jgi:hypothetical protein